MSERDSSIKHEKYQNRLMDELNRFLRTDVKDPRLTFVSITKVDLTNDYSMAKVYWDTFDVSKKDEILSALQKVKGHLRTKLAHALKVRHTPSLEFCYDEQFEAEKNIEKLLKE